MTKIIATPIRNINETVIGIFTGIPLGYIVYFYHGDEKRDETRTRRITIINDTVCAQ